MSAIVTFSRARVAALLHVDEALIAHLEERGLLEPDAVDGTSV